MRLGTWMKPALLALALVFSGPALLACDHNEGPAEELGEAVDDAADDVADELE